MSAVIRILARADGSEDARAGAYLRAWDLDARDGRGEIWVTRDVERAHRFPDAPAALAAWRATSSVRPLRDDGKRNRPLTAFTVEVLDVDSLT